MSRDCPREKNKLKINQYKITRIISLCLVFLLALNPLLFPLTIIYAQEAENPVVNQAEQVEKQVADNDNTQSEPNQTESAEPEITAAENPQPSPDPNIQTEPTEEEPALKDSNGSSITTGDAQSNAQADTSLNNHQDTIDGSLENPQTNCQPPEITINCPEDINLVKQNSAEATGSAEAQSQTGQNTILGADSQASIDTGEAESTAGQKNSLNTNTLLLATPSANLNPAPPATPSSKLSIENQNQATLSAKTNASSQTGQNQADNNQGNTSIDTGQAIAMANDLNTLNLNLISAHFQWFNLNLDQESDQDIDLNQLYKILTTSNSQEQQNPNGQSSQPFALKIDNLGDLDANVLAQAQTGQNQANNNGENTQVSTGQAMAAANLINLVNLNLINSNIFIGLINIFAPFSGNLILPSKEKFLQTNQEQIGLSKNLPSNFQNQAKINSQASSEGDTGQNQLDNNWQNSQVETGNASSIANSLTFVNQNLFNQNWFYLLFNNLGDFNGQIKNWSSPGSLENSQQNPSNTYEAVSQKQTNLDVNDQDQEPSKPLWQIDNQANVNAQAQALASTGNNQLNNNLGKTDLKTGSAKAIANILNMVNLNAIANNWFFGIVNVFSNWQGDVVYAYPDVLVNLKSNQDKAETGQTLSYTVNYTNQGFEQAGNVILEMSLPYGLNFVSDTSDFALRQKGQSLKWQIGSLAPKSSGSFQILVQISKDFDFENPSLFSWLVKPALAAEMQRSKQVVAAINIKTSDPESDPDNNSVSVTTTVFEPKKSVSSSDTTEDVNLEISASNNVNQYVYLNDTITFEVVVKNTGTSDALDAYLIHDLYQTNNQPAGETVLNLGTIPAGKGVKVSFGVVFDDQQLYPPDNYFSTTQVFASTLTNKEVSSNQAQTDFSLKLKLAQIFPPALAASKEGDVLAETISQPLGENENLFPYILLLLVSTIGIAQSGQKIREILAKQNK